MPNYLNRRRQPQVTLKAIEDVLDEIHWTVNQTTSHKFISASGTQVNESFGYELKVPASVPAKKVWVGYVSHQKAPAGIYAQLTPDVNRDQYHIMDRGYQMASFGDYIFIKQIIPIKTVREMENKFGVLTIKKKLKSILKRNYPFNSRLLKSHSRPA